MEREREKFARQVGESEDRATERFDSSDPLGTVNYYIYKFNYAEASPESFLSREERTELERMAHEKHVSDEEQNIARKKLEEYERSMYRMNNIHGALGAVELAIDSLVKESDKEFLARKRKNFEEKLQKSGVQQGIEEALPMPRHIVLAMLSLLNTAKRRLQLSGIQ